MTLLSLSGISKSYPGVRALSAVDFNVASGEIHALVGENGAGKSTLIKVISGAVEPDAGEVRLEGRLLPAGDPIEVLRRGVHVLYQEFTLLPQLSAAENIFLGRERGTAREMRERAQRLLEDLGAKIPAAVRVADLSVAQQQRVEIARALATESKVLVLDEPSAMLTDPEVRRLFEVLRDLRARGLGILYVSHRLEEIFAVADRMTVLRDGQKIATAPLQGLDRAQIIRWMVGRPLSEEFPERASSPGSTVLEVRGLVREPGFRNVSFSVRRGEIVGLAGLVGAGRTSVALAISGAIEAGGKILLEGKAVRFRSPREAIDAGIAYVTEDRKGLGIFPLLDVGANTTLVHLRHFVRAGFLSRRREDEAARRSVRDLDVRFSGLAQSAGTLSGGNQQKLLLARQLLKPRTLLILDEPTRGIDVGAKTEMYALMNRLTAGGLGILMISSELPEILGMSDRVLVMHEGRVAGELSRSEATAERIMSLATGGLPTSC